MISIIIPTLNEESCLAAAIASSRTSILAPEILVVDGGSTDRTRQVATAHGVEFLEAPPGRAMQMNHGAERAQGETLVFLHADSRLPVGGLETIDRTMAESGVVGGKFRLRFDWAHPLLRIAGFCSRFSAPVATYGDQGLFVGRKIFRDMGGFEPVPIFEDQRFYARLRDRGEVRVLPLEVTTSGRRFQTRGPTRQLLANLGLIAAHGFGVGPRRLAQHYPRNPNPRD